MPLYVPRERKSTCEAVDIIKKAKGAAILAHPLLYHLTRGFDELTVRNLARRYDLLESGGSDFHGANKPDIKLGCGRGNLMIGYSYLQAIKDSVNYVPSV